LSMCDAYLGDVLNRFDELKLWDDTMLIVCTDHGFMLGEHDSWAKVWLPFYEEISHTPFFVWDPRSRKSGERRQAIVQPAIDLAPTLLEFFGQTPTEHMRGNVLRDTIASDKSVRDVAMFGIHGGHLNVTDGRYVYMRGCKDEKNSPLNQYTLMPTHMTNFFDRKVLAETQLHDGFSFTRDCKVMKIPSPRPALWLSNLQTMLFDLQSDPKQETPLKDPAVEARMIEHAKRLMREVDAPAEQYERLGL
jgi:arylsulfatase A-like enzyme